MDDMDMDIPHPEELEWLEGNSHFQDDYEEFESAQPYPDDDEEEEDRQPKLSIPSIPSSIIDQQPSPSELQFHSSKRVRPDAFDSSNPDNRSESSDKRIKTGDVTAENENEDWLHYSPPPENADAPVEVILEETTLSRWANEIEGDVIPVTGLDGDRVYAKIKAVNEGDMSKKLDMKANSVGLISESINVLMQKVENNAFTKALQASARCQNDTVLSEREVLHESLWVDKYSPSSFMELLSDEHTNREVLMWLKHWDSCVFGSCIKTTTDDVLSSLRLHSSVSENQKLSGKRFPGKQKESWFMKESSTETKNNEKDDNGLKAIKDPWSKKSKVSSPLEQKILLLCGPPGLGKTTLAHVTARHCGYRVVEINASDDRSSSTLEAKIQSVVEMDIRDSIMADSKPRCLVIDEIDGALGDGKGAVEVILKMVSAGRSDKAKESTSKEEQTEKLASKKKPKKASLTRPVICICNDLYTPALRPLRQVAKVHVFVQPTLTRVVDRLKFICKKEALKTSSIALTTLAQYTECDIRSCLNTLQFLHKKKESLNALEISSQVVGRKDTIRSAFDIWKEIFQKRKSKVERKSGRGTPSDGFEYLHSLISNRGDYDLIYDGIHENVLQLNYHDPVMKKTVKCLNHLGTSDLLHQYIMRTQKMSLLAYQPGIAVSIHGLVAQNERPNIEWPKSFHRCRTLLLEKMEILRSWQMKISPHIGRHLSAKSFVEESISPLLHILSPPNLRPVAVHLLSEKEKNDLSQLVTTMVSYSVTYKTMKTDALSSNPRNDVGHDDLVLTFDPPLTEFINFKDYRPGHFVPTTAVKQLLFHEVEKQKIMRGSISRPTEQIPGCNTINKHSASNRTDILQSSPIDSALHSSNYDNGNDPLSMKKSMPLEKKDSPASGSIISSSTGQKTNNPSSIRKKVSRSSASFFDSFRKPGSGFEVTKLKKGIAETKRDARPLLFKFNEGYTNAVKRPVRMREFLI
ncbi:chromosome transmission fidelity protein 18 homolog [Impatiens glandulifera]|uniref:chromosome transmission fidelity protein 18 homolog n=1 Tax=Impatiens glandulifera TaxID=253017 RepID=UPI001FB059DE|nr:chromosome transmission fidelity protein 18 homolog [Impatiens glandulifera]